MTSRLAALALAVALCASCKEMPGTTRTATDGGPGAVRVVPDGGSAPRSDGGRETPARAYGINHVLSTGQSLSVGAEGYPALSLSQPFGNLMFQGGVIPPDGTLTAFVPLVEKDVETMSSAFANWVSAGAKALPVDGDDHDVLVSGHGVAGWAYDQLKKGTGPYARGMDEVRAGLALSKSLTKTYVVRAVTLVHGETDSMNPQYGDEIGQWQADYEADVRELTGQDESVPMFQSQMSSCSSGGLATCTSPFLALAAAVKAPGKVVMVGPKYFLEYAPDGLHLSNAGYRHLGEYYAKAYRRVILEGGAWEPLRPLSVTGQANKVKVTFSVPSPPLVLDDETSFPNTPVTNPGRYGFEYFEDGGSPPVIAGVAITAPTEVTITLNKTPTGTHRRLRYAYRAQANAHSGPTTGMRGNLRDSDATVSRFGFDLFNWCVHFDEVVE